jgi:uncharacterized repeat protein (TIGR02543 family)
MTKTVSALNLANKSSKIIAKAGWTYDAWTNSNGAVSAVCNNIDGNCHLGVKPDEFEVAEWYDTPNIQVNAENFQELRALVNGAYNLVQLYAPEQSPAQKTWKQRWLATAKNFGAGSDS